jgi:trimeric autotransporter adhesin
MRTCWVVVCLAAGFLQVASLRAAELLGQVKFGGVPVPGAVVTASRGAEKLSTVTGAQGQFRFADVADDTWKLDVVMSGFAAISREIKQGETAAEIELQMLPFDQIKSEVLAAPVPKATEVVPEVAAAKKPEPSGAFAGLEPAELAQKAADGMLINGSAINGVASPFGQGAAFGNNRRTGRSLYNASLGMILDNGITDARPYSLTGQNTPRPDFNRLQGLASVGGPIKIPHILRNGPNVIVTYQWTRNDNITTQSSLVPTLAQRNGDLSQSPVTAIDPSTGVPFPGNIIPSMKISPEAKNLLRLYPLPNFNSARYNFQTSLAGATHDDSIQSRWQQRLTRKNQLSGNFAYQSTRTDSATLFGFVDTTQTTGLNVGVNWLHNFNSRWYSVLGVQFSRLVTDTNPFFADRVNVSGLAGIGGNNQDPVNWGPPALSFASGIATLQDIQYARNRNQTSGVSLEVNWSHGKHNTTLGGDYKRLQWNALYQENPRGTFGFTGASSGNDFAGFLLGIPDTSSLAYGNADKYFRSISPDAYVSDDWRVKSNLTVTIGLRWEYSAPIHEIYGRLVNLEVTPGFGTAVPVTGFASGSLPSSLIRPDRNNLAPRFGFAFRPIAGSSLVLRGGYGIYYDTSVYQWIATQMAQQSPLSTSLRVQNTPENPLTLADGFRTSSSTTQNTFGVDPGFRVGYAQNWQLSVQRDLPRGLVMVATYRGVKGTRAQQQFLPNTYPEGTSDPCTACPTGFAYLTSNGNSIRNSGELEIRRRLRSGLGVTVQYAFSKSIDDASLGGKNQGGPLIAQDWLNLTGERALSYFDQRHLLTVTSQYTSGMGMGGGTLMGGWRGALLKEWTLTSKITAGTGLPLTPLYFAAVAGTGVTGTIRPDYTGAGIYDAPPGLSLNPAAYRTPASGQWGNAGRNSITGPAQFAMNASLGRTFRTGDRLSLDVRLDATNALNHPVFPAWNTTINNSQFGLPVPANPMRSLQTTVRVRF